MPLRTKIDVNADIKDFQASLAALNKYRDAIQKSSSEWVKYGTSVKQALKTAGDVTKHLQQHSLTLDHVSATQRRFGDAARTAGSMFANMARNTGSIANNLARSATSLFDIFTVAGAIGALIGLGGGLFGLEALARGVTGSRREALGLGVEYGRLSAFELNFARYGDAAGMLGAASAGLYDVTSPAYLSFLAAGVSPKGGDAADKMVELMKRLPQIFAGTPEGLIGSKAEALGLTQFWSVGDIIRMIHSPDEVNSQIGRYQQDKLTLAVSPKAQLAWSKFDTAIARAGLNIEKVLADQLVPLSEPLQHLSKSFVDIVNTFAHSKTVGDALKTVEGGLEGFVATVASQEFKQNAQRFLEGVNKSAPYIKYAALLAGAVGRIGWFGGRVLFGPDNPTLGGLIGDILGHGFPGENEPQQVIRERNYMLRLRAAPVPHSLTGTHGREQRDPYADTWYGDDPSIRARQKMQRQQTVSYLDQFQGLRDQKQIVVSDQTHGSVIISSS